MTKKEDRLTQMTELKNKGERRVILRLKPEEEGLLEEVMSHMEVKSMSACVKELINMATGMSERYERIKFIEKIKQYNDPDRFVMEGKYKRATANLRKDIFILLDQISDGKADKDELEKKIRLFKNLLETLRGVRKEEYDLHNMLIGKEAVEMKLKEADMMIKQIKLQLEKQGLAHKIKMDLDLRLN